MPTTAELESSLFVAALICQAQAERLDVFYRENAHLRVVAQKVDCPYGYRAANGACMLGYPGCACMDDTMALLSLAPQLPNAALIRRLKLRADALEQRVIDAKERIRIAAKNYRSMAAGFEADRTPSKAAASRAMADLMEAPL